MLDLSLKTMFQWAFALSPFPSYLPQYFAMIQQLSAPDPADSTDNGSANNVSIDRGTDYYNVRHRIQGIGRENNISLSPGGRGYLVPGTPFKPFSETNDSGEEEVGMSPATVLILLAAHLLRMLYFHGLVLEEEQSLQKPRIGLFFHRRLFFPRASAGDELDTTTDVKTALYEDEMNNNNVKLLSLKPTANAKMQSVSEQPSIQWDLLGQSCSMIIVQVMLLHAMMRLRRKRLSRRKKRSAANEFTDMNVIPHMPHLSPARGPSNGAQQILDTLSPQPFLQRQLEKFFRGIKSHFLQLISPSNILKHHTFLQYMELLCVSSIGVKLMFDYRWYPRYRMRIVEGLKHTSIVLESCLALPQAMKNHSGGTTEGLSLLMVLGWVAGDFFKLCYFLLGMISANESVPAVEHDGNNVFAMGCLLALMVDLIVVTQMLVWYPTADVLQLRERMSQSVRHWKAGKDDDSGKSLLMKSPEYKKSGLFASAVHAFYAIFRRGSSNGSSQSQSMDS